MFLNVFHAQAYHPSDPQAGIGPVQKRDNGAGGAVFPDAVFEPG